MPVRRKRPRFNTSLQPITISMLDELVKDERSRSRVIDKAIQRYYKASKKMMRC